MTDRLFDKNHTNLLKGIAILFMVLHHTVGLYYNTINLQWYSQHSDSVISLIILFFSSAGKVCVQLLTILSGFGLAKSYYRFQTQHDSFISDFRFVLSHLIQFYSIYWVMLLLNTLVYQNFMDFLPNWHGFNLETLKSIIWSLLKVSGLSNLFGLGFGGWFASTIILLYLLFPLLFRLVHRFRYVPVVIFSMPWFFHLLFDNNINIDSVVFCLLAFTTGILFAQTGVLDKLSLCCDTKHKIISFIVMLFVFLLRLIFSIYVDYFFALSLIAFGTIVLYEMTVVKRVLILFGKNSADMWLCHGFILYVISGISIHILLRFIIALVISLLLSVFVEWIKRITRYSLIVKRLRSLIEQ